MLLCFCLFCPCSSWWEVLQQMIQELKNQDSLPVKCLSCYGCSSFSLLLYQLIIWKQISEEWLNRTEEKKRHVHLKNVPYVAHLKNSGTVSHFVYFRFFFNFAVCQNSSGPHTSSAVQQDRLFQLAASVLCSFKSQCEKKKKTLMLFTKH